MSVTHTITRSYKDQSSTAISLVEAITASAEDNVDTAVVVSTDTSIPWKAVRANLRALVIYSDRILTIETNSAGSPVDTIVLVAGQALIWTLATDGLAKCPFTVDVTGLFVTNASGGTAALKIRALVNT